MSQLKSYHFYFTPQTSHDIKPDLQKKALKQNLLGHVRDRADGQVEGMIHGDEEDCQSYFSWLQTEDFCVNLEHKETSAVPNVEDFQILF